jgi:coenzyme F420 hydrogenase subunit delta
VKNPGAEELARCPLATAEPIYKDVVVLGCGNILFGDDGFGTHVAEHLERECLIPSHVSVINAGTGVREILFDLVISDLRPKKVIVIDAVDKNRRPGDIFRIDVGEVPIHKVDDFSLHHLPTTNLLKELNDLCNVEVIIIVGQVESIPDMVRPGLSDVLAKSVALAAQEVLRACG